MDEKGEETDATPVSAPVSPAAAALAVVLAALLPGLGHAFLGRVRRGAAYFAIVATAFVVGLLLHGRLPALRADRPLAALAAFTVSATGLLNFVSRLVGWGAGDIRSATYEYGSTYLLTAGLMNVLLIGDAWDVARGRKR